MFSLSGNSIIYGIVYMGLPIYLPFSFILSISLRFIFVSVLFVLFLLYFPEDLLNLSSNFSEYNFSESFSFHVVYSLCPPHLPQVSSLFWSPSLEVLFRCLPVFRSQRWKAGWLMNMSVTVEKVGWAMRWEPLLSVSLVPSSWNESGFPKKIFLCFVW